MTYKETLSFLYTRLPMYQRIGATAYKADLNNTIALCKMLGNPEGKFKSVHIAGTNGKGSVSHMLAAILQSAGYKVGLYTSPHLKDFRERIKINRKMIPKKRITDFVHKHKQSFAKINLSFFEWTVGLAFDFFVKEKVDIAIIETGLGGRLDSTNVINPLLSIITNISYDHQVLLGNTLQKIATEKAGIIKNNGIVIISEKQKETKNVFIRKAKKENAHLLFTSDYISSIKGIKCGLKGNYQQKNIPTVLLASCILNELGYDLNSKDVNSGLKNVITLTGLRGRWDVLSTKPLLVTDIAHNEAGIKELCKQIKTTPHNKLHIVLGTVSDKDINKILNLLPKNATYYFCQANIPRALDANLLANNAKAFGLNGAIYKSVRSAIHAAKKNASVKDFILITGSAFVVAEAI